MLEIRAYTKPELAALLGTKTVDNLKKKLNRYNVEYDISGRGEKAIFDIKKINEPFKVFCITELGFNANTDFKALAYFYYYYFNDDEFMAMPNEVKMFRMEGFGKYISRQTIAVYTSKLVKSEMIYIDIAEFIYYFAFHDKQFITNRKVYAEAWKYYWEIKDEVGDGSIAMNAVRHIYGGVPRKQAIPQVNAFHLDKIEMLLELVYQIIEYDMEKKI